MAFATKYLFKFNSVHGAAVEVRIQQDGYSGAAIQRALGRPPVLKRGQNGPICGTSLELYAECLVDGEFASLYTSNPKEYKAQLLRGNTVIWEGFVSTELYSEPGIAPPYDVQIIATDGLGELKLVNYEAQGEISLSSLFVYLLSFTGIDRVIYFAWKIKDNDGTIPGLLDGGLIDLDYMAGETCYDVLTYVLDSFHATISAHKDDWVIMRETDLTASETRLAAYRIPAGGGSASLTYFSYINKSVGQMGVADLWPVGNYSTKIEPARKSVTLYAPWHVNNILRNPNLIYAQGGWTLSEYANWVSFPNREILIGQLGQWAYVSQSFNLQSLQSEIDISAMIAMLFRADIPSTWFVYAIYQTEDRTFYGDADGWVDEQPPGVRVSHNLGIEAYVQRHYEKYEETIPNPYYTDPGVLTIVIGGRVIALGGPVYMTLAPANKGYKDVIHIDNDARGDGAEVEVLHGRIMAEEFTYPDLLSGALKKVVSGIRTYIYKFADADNSNADFLALAALSYAKSVGLPRLRREGVFDMPSTENVVPFFLTMESVRHIVETYDWDLYNEEVKFSVLSIPSAAITVESETVAPLDDSYTGVGSSSGGPGGGGGGGSPFDLSGYVQITRLAADEAIIAEAIQSLQSQIDAVSARDMFDELTATVVSSDVLTATEAYMGYAHASRYYLTDSIYFWAESVNGVMCVRLNAPLITAGDQIVISGTPGGGGGGGASYLDELLDVTITLPSNGQTLFYQDGIWVNGNIDFSNYYTKAQVDDIIGTIQQFHYEVYASLEDVTDPQNNVLYLIGPTGSGEDKYEEYVYSGGWVKIGDTSIDLSGYVQTTRLDADEAIIAEAIQSLQSQIDAVSARDNYDELTASALYADMLAATYAYAERYYLTDGVFFYIETVNGVPCVKLNAPFITGGDQVIISGTPGGGGGGGITLYDYDQVKAMTADVALTAPSAWAMHQMWAEIFGGASSVLTSDNYTNYVNTTNFPGLDKVGTVTSVATGTGLTGGPITASGTISIDPTYLGYISHGETAYGWGDILTQAIQSLQSQVDSVSARNNYDELTASAFFGDIVSASALYAGSIELAGEDLETAVTGIRTRLSSVEGKFDADGSALSAVKLKTSRNIWGRPFDGTADVTGDLNLNGSSILGTLGNPVLSMTGMNGNYWVVLGSMSFETRRYNPMIVGHTYISGSSTIPSSVPSETLYVDGTSAFDGDVEIKTGRTLTIGGAVFTWVPAEGDTPGYLRLSTAFVTEGDQIILSGEPGGGGQGVGYLYELEDVSDELATPTTGMVLYYDGTEWIGVAATEIGGVTSVVGAAGDVTVTQIIDAITEEGLPWSAITEKPTTLAGYGITDAATASSVTALTTRVGTLESNETIISLALQSLQSQVDSVSARNDFDELTATVLFADTLSATSAFIGTVNGNLSGNATTASYLVGSSYGAGSATQPVYFSGGLPVACTYSINAATTSGTAGRLAYYAGTNAISDFYNTIGGATQPMYLNAGVPTACTYTLNAALLASSTAGRLAYYSGTNAVSEYYGNVGSGVIPMYFNAGVPTASTSTVGSASLPVYLNAGTITACTAASLFSALGSNTVNNLEVTVAGQLRTITNLYATYDGAGENISDKFTIVSSAIQSLQSQIDSVATRFGTDECIATTAYFDMLSVGAYIYAGALVTTGDQTVASDATLKTNWRGLNYGIEDIARATAGVFDWKDGHGTSAGTIAQEWKALIPELVHGVEGGMSLAYGQAAMLNTILLARHETEQDREIRQLKARVSELETRLKIRS